jgi:hypothetical protein
MVISQFDLLQSSFILFAVFFGFLLASVAAFLKDWSDLRRLREALYRELIIMYDAFKYIEESLKKDIDSKSGDLESHLKWDYRNLKLQWSADTYTNAKATPVIFLRVEDAESINSVHYAFRSLEKTLENSLEVEITELTIDLELAADIWKLYEGCLDSLKEVFKGKLDKKMLLKAAASVGSSREYWEELLPEPEAQQPKKWKNPLKREVPK